MGRTRLRCASRLAGSSFFGSGIGAAVSVWLALPSVRAIAQSESDGLR